MGFENVSHLQAPRIRDRECVEKDRLVRYICQGECETIMSLVDRIGVVASVNTRCTRCRVEIADSFLLFRGRLEKTADRPEDDLELSVVNLFEFVDAFREIRVLGNDLPEVNECTHDLDVYADRAVAAEHAGEHRDAVFGERVRSASA